jgi:hypothetical protein
MVRAGLGASGALLFCVTGRAPDRPGSRRSRRGDGLAVPGDCLRAVTSLPVRTRRVAPKAARRTAKSSVKSTRPARQVWSFQLCVRTRSVVGGSRGWRADCLRTGGGSPCESNASWHDWVSGNAEGSVSGGDRALATTSGRHHGQAIRIDSFGVDDCLLLGPPPGSVKARRRILATSCRCTHKERCPRIERQGALSRTASAKTCHAPRHLRPPPTGSNRLKTSSFRDTEHAAATWLMCST